MAIDEGYRERRRKSAARVNSESSQPHGSVRWPRSMRQAQPLEPASVFGSAVVAGGTVDAVALVSVLGGVLDVFEVVADPLGTGETTGVLGAVVLGLVLGAVVLVVVAGGSVLVGGALVVAVVVVVAGGSVCELSVTASLTSLPLVGDVGALDSAEVSLDSLPSVVSLFSLESTGTAPEKPVALSSVSDRMA